MPRAWKAAGTEKCSLSPVTTIAWRLSHLHYCFAGEWEWTFGERRHEPKLLAATLKINAEFQQRNAKA